MEIPGASQHREAEKAGYLTKLSGRSFPYIAQWKRRYCVLSKGRLYYYEREDSKAGEKTNGVINLEYFDQVTEAGPKDCKKATNVFIITSQDRSFFDPGRHLFSADTLPDMKDWVRKLQSALEQIRNNTRPSNTSTSTSPSLKKDGGSGKKGKEHSATESDSHTNSKERKKKKESHRSRKSAKVGDGPGPQQNQEESSTPGTQRREAEVPAMASSVGIQLPGMVPRGGVALPGLSPTRKEPLPEDTKEMMAPRDVAIDPSQQSEDGLPVSAPTLTCVTKLRNKGPQGRRAPQNRRGNAALAQKKRASSLSALEYQDLNDNSEDPWLNRSLDMLDDGHTCGRNGELSHGCNPTLPYKAYNYSSDEELGDDGEHSQTDSLPTSASAMPPPPPPRSASYGLELRQNPPLGQAGRQVLHRSLGDAQGSGGDVRGSRHSLRDGRMVHSHSNEWRSSQGEQWIGSNSSLGLSAEIIGSASPVMDDLDNLLMNQSIQQTSMALDSASESGSEGSTCRLATNQHHHQPAAKKLKHHHHHHHHHKASTSDLTQFAMAVKHLQRHVVEIDRAVFGITGEVTGTRQEVTSLKEAVLALQADTDTITSTLSHLTEEAISAQQKITFATQEAEKVRKIANVALKEAEQARQEQLKAKKEYESLLGEMKTTIKSVKEVQMAQTYKYIRATSPMTCKESVAGSVSSKKQEGSNNKAPIPKANISFKSPEMNFKPAEESLRSSSPRGSKVISENYMNSSTASKSSEVSTQLLTSSKSGEESLKSISSTTAESQTSSSSSSKPSGGSESVSRPPPVSKSNSLGQVSNAPKLPAYQSLFARPSSLISGIAQRSSLTKSVSFADQKDEERKSDDSVPKESKEIKKKDDRSQSTLERKDKKDQRQYKKEDKLPSYDTNSKERKSREKKDHNSIDRKERKHRHKDRRSSQRGSKEEEHMISNLSLDDIPMADDNSNELLDRVGVSEGKAKDKKIQGLSNSTQTPSNFSLGKSSSSPVVAPGPLASKPKSLPLKKDTKKTEPCNSNASTPESAEPKSFPQISSITRPTSPCRRSSSSNAVVEENHSSVSPTPRSLHRPGSTPGPLARQGSMTTVPEDRAVVNPPPPRPGVFAISRQNSTPNIPLQRQNSGVAIPLQRQHSLGTVPEEGRLPRQDSLMSVPEERPLVDRTLPLSPSQSMTYFPISPSASASTVSESVRRAARASMELVTGPVLSGSAMQEASATGTLAVLTDPEEELKPTATSTLKKESKAQKDIDGVVI